MFTGIVRAVGSVKRIERRSTGARIAIGCADLPGDVEVADSVAVNGVCLTVIETFRDGFLADVSQETLARSNLGRLSPGAAVNVEPSLKLSDKLGGHMVFGHVDGLGTVEQLRRSGEFYDLVIAFPPHLERYIAQKGSIAVDGISLTVASLDATRFSVAIIPFTFDHTNLRHRRTGDLVNLEVDILARYVERILSRRERSVLTKELLREHGFE